MTVRIVEELRPSSPNIILDGLEEAKVVLVFGTIPLDESIILLDENGWDIWVNNRESLLNSLTNVIYEWNQEEQILKRTFEFENEELYDEYRYMCNSVFPSDGIERELILREIIEI
jgi:hypothetical protein